MLLDLECFASDDDDTDNKDERSVSQEGNVGDTLDDDDEASPEFVKRFANYIQPTKSEVDTMRREQQTKLEQDLSKFEKTKAE